MSKKPKKVVGVEPPRLKPITYEALLSLELKEIEELFPLGASQDGKKWIPATGKPDRTLARLLRDKRKRIQPTRLLGKTHGYTTNPLGALKTWPDDAGEAVDEQTQREQTMKAKDDAVDQRATDETVERQAKVIANKIAKVQRQGAKLGVDMGPAFQRFIREQQAEIASRRKEAA